MLRGATLAPQTGNPVEPMAHQLTTQAGRALYVLHKHTIEPAFNLIKHVLGFRQFSLRELWRKPAGSGRW